MTKNQIRINFKELRNNLTPEEQSKLSSDIREKLFLTESYRKCKKLFTFVSFQSEVDTQEIIRQALRMGKQVYIPRVEGKAMNFYEISDLKDLLPSQYGVLEPADDETKRYLSDMDKSISTREPFCNPYNIINVNNINLMLLPGLAFDRKGNRIGYGAGYYDRYLVTHPEANFYKLAVAYDFQALEEIPSEEFDIKVDAIITPTRFIECCQ